MVTVRKNEENKNASAVTTKTSRNWGRIDRLLMLFGHPTWGITTLQKRQVNTTINSGVLLQSSFDLKHVPKLDYNHFH